MNLLAVDTATEKFSAALSCGSETWFFMADAGLRHSELIMDSVDILMKKALLKPADLSGVVCTGGPGSFTGLRIGYSLAKGLALSLGIPFAAIPTLDCMARPFLQLPNILPGIIVPVIDAKKQAFFCALYSGGKRLCPDMDASPAEIVRAIAAFSPENKGPAFLIGPGAQTLRERLTATADTSLPLITAESGLRWGDALSLLEIAKETQVFEKNTCDYFSGPEYLRKSDAEILNGTGGE